MGSAESQWTRLTQEAQRVVDETLGDLPPDVRHHANTLGLSFETVPSKALRREGFDADLLGLFSGPSLGEPLDNDPTAPTITLFLNNLWDYAERDWPTFSEEVRTTYLHELGHYLGLDEDGLADRDLD